ncbi:C-type lectin domain family 4 member D-like isoform X2 [Aythya fuligula]|uniref:C-type lectin domain family 4 member D-like isoform X2 n=1 Tax=Aythya fuligula TaxID=219594 RepID=A0A6J3EQR9_AYTFU|nr:C-type lectin domain family 4 member D-like isoform X2 [Aythya fuligula]
MNQQERVSPGTAVVLFHRSCGQCKTLPHNAPGWHCIPNVPASQSLSSPTKDSWKCCPVGWRPFQESCYYFSDDQMPWDESQQNCSGMGSHLVVINTEAEQAFLYKEIGRQFKHNQTRVILYIGLRAQKVGQWRWADQTPYNETAAFWRPGEPSNVPEEMCVVFHQKAENLWNWNDVPCTASSYRICETAAETI